MSSSNYTNSPFVFHLLTTRLRVFAGYLLNPTTYDAMLFYLPPIQNVTTRAVRIRDRLWELWSPNSLTHAYYPGLSSASLVTGTELDPVSRRCNGHLGRFDYTINPQHFEDKRPWLGFTKKALDSSLPENCFIHNVWIPNNIPNSGRFKLSFITAVSLQFSKLLKTANNIEDSLVLGHVTFPKRPVHLTSNGAIRLNAIKNNDAAVDTLASVQRDLKELDAWVRMARSYSDHPMREEELEIIPRADDSLIGVWLNGCDEKTGLWLLRCRVPCFMVHESDGDQDWRRIEQLPIQCVLMTTRTHVAYVDARTRTYERWLLESHQELLSLERDEGQARYEDIPRSMRADRQRSSSYGQGYRNGVYLNPRVATASSNDVGQILMERDGKVQPPRVIAAAEKGHWTLWMEDSLDSGMECIRMRSKSYRGQQGNNRYFDRENKRILFLDEPLSIPLHYEADHLIYGLPAPSLPYVFSSDDLNYKLQASSLWVYTNRDPDKKHIGLEHDGSVGTAPPPATAEDYDDSSMSLGSEMDYTEESPVTTTLEKNPEAIASQTSDCYLANNRSNAKDEEESGSRPILMNRLGQLEGSYDYRVRSSRGRTRSPRAIRGNDGHRGREYVRSKSRDNRQRSDSRHYSPRRPPSSEYLSRTRRSRSPSPRHYRRYRSRSPSPRRKFTRSPSPNFYRHRLHSPPPSVTDRYSRHDYQRPESSTAQRNDLTLEPKRDASSSPSTLVPFEPENAKRRSLISRIGQMTETRKLLKSAELASSMSLIPVSLAPATMSLFSGLDAPPVASKLDIKKNGQSRFLVIWNLPVVLCWDNVLEWLKFVLTLCIRVRLLQVLRTNEMGYQVFWLVFKNEEQAQKFRGVVADRFAGPGFKVKCDYASQDEYCAIVGHCVDRWDEKRGFLNGQIGSSLISDEVRPYLSHFGLARRLKVPYVAPPKTRRIRRKDFESTGAD